MKKLIVVLMLLLCMQAFAFKMAGMGNSIGAGYMAGTDGIGFLGESLLYKLIKMLVRKPDYNFMTGSKINSHCERLKKQWGGQWDCENFAIGGAEISDVVLQQLPLVMEFDPDYVVLEIGGNDICDSSITPVKEFEYSASIIAEQLSFRPRAVVIMAMPDLTALYDLKDKKCFLGMKCSKIWNYTKSCPTVTDGKNLDVVRDTIAQYNNVLKNLSNKYRYYYTEKTKMFYFKSKYVSHIDGFHPSKEGQKLLSDLTYPFTKGEQ